MSKRNSSTVSGLGIENPAFIDDINVEIIEKNTKIDLDSKGDDENGEYVERSSWDSPIEFLLSCISMSVGLGNIWRFPFAAYENGGGAFLIPYLIVLVFIGRPIYFLEMSIGQFASYGSVKIWSLSPFFKGVGFMGMLAGAVIVSYYCSIIATTIFYLVVSFQKTLPWTVCDEKWTDCQNCTYSDCSQLYYDKTVTEQSDNIDDGLGAPLWKLTLCLLAGWLMIFFSLVKGVQSSGKVAYFTAIFPYVVLLIFLVRGLTLEGAWTGIEYFITPDWAKIYEPQVWYAAVGQCFFSLGTGVGTITMLSSYNRFRNRAYKDALIISGMDTFTSLLGGCTIFAVLGHLSHITGKKMEDVTEGGPGLAFVSYPNAISKFTWAPQLFSVLFFLMLLTLGIGTANALTGAIITIISDQFPKIKRWMLTLAACIIGFLLGLIYVTPGGQFMVTFMDFYGSGFILYLICMLEVTAVAWFYGVNNFMRDIEFMLHVKVGWYWKISWGFIIPVGLFVILIYTFATAEELTHNKTPFPTIATVFGWLLAGFAIILLPICAVMAALKTKGNSFGEKLKNSVYPHEKWGPRATNFRKGWNLFKNHTEIKTSIPISDNKSIDLSFRGIKERFEIKLEKSAVLIKLANVGPEAEIIHKEEKTGFTGFIYRIFGWKFYSWKIDENGFESFYIIVNSVGNILKGKEWKKETGDLTIKIHF